MSGLTHKVRTAQELLSYCMAIPESGCWIWHDLSLGPGGYGQIWHAGKRWLAHRLAYTLTKGAIPEGLDIDHLCRVRPCINVYHLEPVTRQVNIIRGLSPELSRERQLAITHCPSGHAYTPENTRIHRAGYRYCITCHREQSARACRELRARRTKLRLEARS